MKKILLSIIALCCTVVAGAQNSSQIVSAILQTDDETTQFYGADALKSAYNAAAQTGSVITLTSGQFNFSVDIKKSVAIYGVGFENDATPGVQRTIINGTIGFKADSDGNIVQNARLEGVYVNSSIYVNHSENLTIAKCQFTDLVIEGTGVGGMLVRQCYFRNFDGSNYQIEGITLKNNYISGEIGRISADSQVLFDHNILSYGGRDRYAHACASYTNNIILSQGWYGSGVADNSYAANNAFAIGTIPESVTSENNKFGVNFSTFFSDGATNANYTTDRTFTIADPDTYKGTDGTPIGVVGGTYPWYKQPEIPYVKDLNATVSGTDLNVSYEAGVRTTNPPTE